MEAVGNRVLVLLPFCVFLSSLFLAWIIKRVSGVKRLVVISIIMLLFLFQTIESAIWVHFFWQKSPQQASSEWMQKTFSKNTVFAIENIPIYQQLPEIALKEFYNKKYNISGNKYYYEVIDKTTKQFPSVVIISNDYVLIQYLTGSSEKEIIKTLNKKGYKKTKIFSPDFRYYSYLGSELDYYLSGLIALPSEIAFYEKK